MIMYKLKVSFITLLILMSVLLLHLYGMAEHLYIKYWFYDIIAHILGGVGITMSLYCISLFLKIEINNKVLSIILLLTFLAGLSWELFEIYFKLTGSRLWTMPYYFDTVMDLLNDMIGSVLVCLTIKYK